MADGNVVSYDGGKFCIRVYTNMTDGAIKMQLAVRVSDAFKSKHKKCTFYYEKPNGEQRKIPSKKLNARDIGTYFPLGKKWYSNKDYKTVVKVTIGGKTSKVEITASKKPAKATDITATYNNDNNISVTAQLKAAAAKPIRTVKLLRKTDSGDDSDDNVWTEVDSHTYPAGTTGGIIKPESITLHDQGPSEAPEAGHRYRYAVVTENHEGNAGRAYMLDYKGNKYVYTHPAPVENVAHERIDDKHNRITFTRSAADVDIKVITQAVIERSVNGGAWIAIDTIGVGEAVGPTTVTYIDDTTTPDNSYSYRVRSKNPQLEAVDAVEEGGTEPTYNTPAPPQKILATYQSNGNVLLTLTQNSQTAENTEIQRSVNGGAWVTLTDDDGVLTTYTDNDVPTGSTLLYRARNLRDDPALASDYTLSNSPETLSKPNPPTITAPINGQPIVLGDDLRIAWIHNPTDGTAQTQARVIYKINNGTEHTVLTADSFYVLPISAGSFSPNDTVTIQVQTKGQNPEFSERSESVVIPIYAEPQLSITSPVNSSTIGSLPINVAFTYTDDSGSLAGLRLDVLHGGETVYSEDLDTSVRSFDFLEYLFENQEYYQLTLTARSSSGLSVSDSVSLYIDYDVVEFEYPWFIDTDIDEDTGIVAFNVSEAEEEIDGGLSVTVTRAMIYRVVNGERSLVAEVGIGDQVVDFYAPLNVDFDYEILEQASTGQIMVLTQSYQIDSDFWYVYYGDKVARAQWQPAGDVALSRPEREEIRYSGRTYPVSYDSTAMGETYSFKCTLTDREELNHFIEMMRLGGHGVWKSGNGEVYDANFDFAYSADYTKYSLLWNCTLSVTRVDA